MKKNLIATILLVGGIIATADAQLATYWQVGGNSSPLSNIIGHTNASQPSLLFRAGSTNSVFSVSNLGRIGIGINNTSPGVELDVRGVTNPGFILSATGVPASAVMGIATSGSSYSANAVVGDVVFGPKGGGSHDLILSCQNGNSGSIRFKSGPIGGDVEYMTIRGNGLVGIGTNNPQFLLDVAGTIRACEVRVNLSGGWCDYVFDKNYKLMPFAELEKYINDNHHLPKIPAAAEVDKNGLDMGSMQISMMEKIEELTLYMLQLKKENDALKARLEAVENNGK